jgi:hypothetical protein
MPNRPTTDAWNAEATAVRRLAKVIREILTQHPEETSGEIASLVKDRLRALRIPWEPRQLDDMLSALDRRLTGERVPPKHIPEVAQQVDPPWRTPRTPSSDWTSIRALADQMLGRSKRRSDPST